MSQLLTSLQSIEDFLWSYLGLFLIVGAGLYFSITSKFKQFTGLPSAFSYFLSSLKCDGKQYERGTSTLKVFFASLGGCVGLGNIVSVAIAIQIGGPGALVWVWLVAFLGMIIKYAEVYLGLKFRVENKSGSYDGGPMFFLKHAFPKWPIITNITAILMCFYGVEIYMFSVIKETFVENFAAPQILVVAILLATVVYSVLGGIKRVGALNAWLVPIFIGLFLLMVGYVLILNISHIPSTLLLVIKTAFSGHAAVGGVAGSTIMLTAARGISSACYSGDVGIGYASIIQSETEVDLPEKQASLAMVGIFVDTLIICTATILLVLITGVWTDSSIKGIMLVQMALSHYFPYMDIFMSAFIFMLGFSTITAYMCAGVKAAQFLSPRRGKLVFLSIASIALVFFSFFDASLALSVMLICGILLMVINIPGLLILRKHINYNF